MKRQWVSTFLLICAGVLLGEAISLAIYGFLVMIGEWGMP